MGIKACQMRLYHLKVWREIEVAGREEGIMPNMVNLDPGMTAGACRRLRVDFREDRIVYRLECPGDQR